MKATILGLGWVTTGGWGPASAASGFALANGELPELARRDVFADPFQRYGRLDRFSRLGLAAIAFALRDAGLEAWQQKRPVGVIADTRYGCLATDTDYFDTVLPAGGSLASPNLFAYTLPNCFLGEAAIRFGLTGTSFIVSGDAPGRLGALRLAMESLAWGEEATVLAGCCDLGPPPGFAAAADLPPGAVFAVLTQNAGSGYGEVAIAGDGVFRLNGETICDWSDLVRAAQQADGRRFIEICIAAEKDNRP